MDAALTDLPMSATAYLGWLRSSHASTDDWQCFDLALGCLSDYESARESVRVLTARQTDTNPSDDKQTDTASSTNRNVLFVALSRQIVAQEEFRVAVDACLAYCDDARVDGDVMRLAEWMRNRLAEAADESRISSLLS